MEDTSQDEIFDIQQIEVTPEKSKIEEGIAIKLKFLPKKDVEGIQWRLTYIIGSHSKIY